MNRALGRGLEALIPGDGGKKGEILFIPVEKIKPSPYQIRNSFPEEKIKELSDSIKEKGVIQPVVVEHRGDHYELIAGERRMRAARMAGISEIPAIVRDGLSEGDKAEISLLENVQREDLNPVELAAGYRRLMDEFKFTQEELAARIGKSRSAVANFLRILDYPEELRLALQKGEITEGHARALMALDDAKQRLGLLRKLLREHLSVREIEEAVARTAGKTAPAKRTKSRKDIFIQDLEQRLIRKTGTKVEIISRKKKGSLAGKIILSFHSDEELNRLLKYFR